MLDTRMQRVEQQPVVLDKRVQPVDAASHWVTRLMRGRKGYCQQPRVHPWSWRRDRAKVSKLQC